MASNLFVKDRYISQVSYLINHNIQEWDISKANISVLLRKGAITREKYNYYYNLPKHKREVSIGCLMRDNPNISRAVSEGLMEARKNFIEANNVEDWNILYIDKDSITTIDLNHMVIHEFGPVNFRPKNKYTSFYRLFGIDLLYFNDGNNESFRLKNANERIIPLHMQWFLDMVLAICYNGQEDIYGTLQMIKGIYAQYVSGNLPIEFYREFNQRSEFKFKTSGVFEYYTDIPPDSTGRELIDILYNSNVLRLLYKIFAMEYFKRVKRRW